MKIEIDKNGILHIERAGKMKKQGCPYSKIENCGDWCPHFQEPDVCDGTVYFVLCETNLRCDTADFTDNRNTQE